MTFPRGFGPDWESFTRRWCVGTAPGYTLPSFAASLARTLLWSCMATGVMNCARSDVSISLAAVRTRSGDTAFVHLTSSLNAIAAMVDLDTVRAEMRFDDSLVPLQSVGDVSTFPDGRVVVLDLEAGSIALYDAAGRWVRELAHRGDGPDGLTRPVAIATLDSDVVVLQADERRGLLKLSVAGKVLTSAPAPPDADWHAMIRRGPRMFEDGFSVNVSGAEDVSRRLSVADHSVLVLTQRAPPAVEDTGSMSRAHILRFDAQLRLVDTVAHVPAIRVRTSTSDPFLQAQQWYVSLFEARPIFSAWNDQSVIGWSADTFVVMHDTSLKQVIKLSWHRAGRAVSDRDREAVAEAIVQRSLLLVPGAAASVSRMPRSEFDAQIKLLREHLPFSLAGPELMAMYGTSSCLWLLGFDPKVQADGTALTLVGINPRRGGSAAALRIVRPDGRIRHVDDHAVFVSSYDSTGAVRLERFPLTGAAGACESP